MGGYRSIGIDCHGPPLDEDGKSIPDEPNLHIRVWFGCHEEGSIFDAIFQLDAYEQIESKRMVDLDEALQVLRDDADRIEPAMKSDMGRMVLAAIRDAVDVLERHFSK